MTDLVMRSDTGASHGRTSAVFLAWTGVCLACALAVTVSSPVSLVLISLALGTVFLFALCVPTLKSLSLRARVVVILLALRPLLDAMGSRTILSGYSLQDAYAIVFVSVLFCFWLRADYSYELGKRPNVFLLGLLALSTVSLATGGISAGMNSFVRTIWGLIVALLLGPIFRTEREITTFIRAVFYSSIFLLLFLPLNLHRGEYFGDLWRVGGQYDVPNTLAAVAFSFFAYGLYLMGTAQTRMERVVCASLLGMLALAIVLTQSRTVGALVIMSVALWLWTMKWRRLLAVFAMTTLALLLLSNASSSWRLLSSFDLKTGEASPDLVNLTGRDFLWGQTLLNYMDASFLHKVVGLGWGTVRANFAWLDLESSSITENSFLWFLVGTGALGLVFIIAYLLWILSRLWGAWRRASGEFDRALASLGLVVILTFVVEGFTTDLVISPVASGYLYAFCPFVLRPGSDVSRLDVQLTCELSNKCRSEAREILIYRT